MIYIILPVYNREITTLKFIDCLINQSFKNYRLILVDDGSNDGTSYAVKSKLPDAIIIRGNGKLWWAGSLQSGYNWLNENNIHENETVLFINDDTEFDSDFLQTASEIIDSNKNVLLKSLSHNIDTNIISDGYVFADLENLKFTETSDKSIANCVSTRGLFLKLKTFRDIGGFRPKLLPHYLSDYEFTIRAHKKGYQIMTDNRLFLYADFKTTGIQNIQSYPCFKYLRKLFSNSNASNPIHWINFIYIVSDNKFYMIKNIIRVILWTIKNFIVSITISFKLRTTKFGTK